MEYQLQTKLRFLLEKNSLSVAEAERQAGLKTSAVRNILNGQSRNPSGQTLQKLSHVLDCSIYDLLDNIGEEKPVPHHPSCDPEIENFDLLSQSVNIICKLTTDLGKTTGINNFFYLAEQIYKYSINSDSKTIDQNFAKWIINEKLR